MAKFYIEQLTPINLKGDNAIVYLRECLQLIKDSVYKEELLEVFEFDIIKDKSPFPSFANEGLLVERL